MPTVPTAPTAPTVPTVPTEVLSRYGLGSTVHTRPFGTGLINKTFVTDGSPPLLLQQLHPVFSPRIHEDIAAVTQHLQSKNLVTPTLVPTLDGALYTQLDGALWRAETFISDSVCFDKIPSLSIAHAAGSLVGRFHSALSDFDYRYRGARANVHDTQNHLQLLRAALTSHTSHPYFFEVKLLAQKIFSTADSLPPLPSLPLRNAHGDLKLSNLLFDHNHHGLCLVDLDTLTVLSLAHELGDALRSWCNPAGEDTSQPSLDTAILTAALEGYARENPQLTETERDTLIDGLAWIALELSARFARDALEDTYFGWNPSRYASRSEHNLVRAQGQWALASDTLSRRRELTALARRALTTA